MESAGSAAVPVLAPVIAVVIGAKGGTGQQIVRRLLAQSEQQVPPCQLPVPSGRGIWNRTWQ